MLTNKQINQIKKEYPGKSVGQIAGELKLPFAEVYKALGLEKDLWALRLENAMEILVIMLLALAPLIFMHGMHDFADLPQRTFIQTVVTLLVLLWAAKTAIKQEIKVFKNPLYFFAAGFMLWFWTTLVWAQNRYEGYYASVHLSFCVVVLLVISTTFNRDRCFTKISSRTSYSSGGSNCLWPCAAIFSVAVDSHVNLSISNIWQSEYGG